VSPQLTIDLRSLVGDREQIWVGADDKAGRKLNLVALQRMIRACRYCVERYRHYHEAYDY